MDLKNRVSGGTPKIGTILAIDHPATIEIATLAGFDWLWVDAEHGRFNELSAATACAINAGGPPMFVRVPDLSETTLKRYLDIGADGLILPQVSSLEDARAIARAALYPPRGQRSVGIGRAHGYGMNFSEYLAGPSGSLIAQIETLGGVSAVDSIVGEPYIDAIIIGPYDLSGSCGVPGDIACRQVQQGIARVLRSCKDAGKPCGIFAATADAAQLYVAQGFDLIGVGLDSLILGNAYRALLAEARRPGDSLGTT
jgi:2-keto-3-deoxy-L-rhamnonate aldolase RhmA